MNFDLVHYIKNATIGTGFYPKIKGYYFFTMYAMGSWNSNDQIYIQWRVNGAEHSGGSIEASRIYDYDNGTQNKHLQVSGNCIAYLKPGDWISLYNAGSNTVHQYYNRFTGFYLSS